MIGETRFARRILVLSAYALFLGLVLLGAITGTHVAFGDLGFVLLLFLMMVGQKRVADRVRRQQRPHFPKPDERDVAIRNHASYIALNVVAWYTLVLCVASGVVIRFPSPHRMPLITEYALLPLLVIAFTLPSAIILWIEPDLANNNGS